MSPSRLACAPDYAALGEANRSATPCHRVSTNSHPIVFPVVATCFTERRSDAGVDSVGCRAARYGSTVVGTCDQFFEYTARTFFTRFLMLALAGSLPVVRRLSKLTVISTVRVPWRA